MTRPVLREREGGRGGGGEGGVSYDLDTTRGKERKRE